MYEEKIEELTEKDKDYDELKNYFCNKIKIYESLKDNNIKPKELNLDHGEDLENEWVDVKDILKKSGDLKTILAVSLFKD